MSQNNPFSSGSNPNMLSSEADSNTNDNDMVTNSQRSGKWHLLQYILYLKICILLI